MRISENVTASVPLSVTIRDFPSSMEKARICEPRDAPCRLVFLADHGALSVPVRSANWRATAVSAAVRRIRKEDRLR